MEIFGVIILIFALWLVFQRWFWMILFFLAALSSTFTMFALIFHFQIIAAVGMFFLSGFLWVFTGIIVEE